MLKNLRLTIQTRVFNSRVVLVVCLFSDHKCRHGNVYAARCNTMHKKPAYIIIISIYVPPWCNKCLIYNRFYCFILCFIDISITRMRYSANPKAPDSWPIRECLGSQNDELCQKRRVSEAWSIEERSFTVCKKIMCFLTLNHINTLHYTKYTK